MKLIYFQFIYLYCSIFYYAHGQSFSFHGGYRPNNLIGTHFSVKADVYSTKKWTFATTYTLVKYQDWPANLDSKVGFHIQNDNDQTIIPFPELKRGYAFQNQERDRRPRNLYHRFSLFAGYKFLNNKHFITNLYFGPHLSLNRTILSNVTSENAPVILNEGDDEKIFSYTDYQIYRSWDVGVGSRLEAEYKLFQNVSIGLSSQMFFDVLQEGIDLVVGGGITYHFTPSKK